MKFIFVFPLVAAAGLLAGCSTQRLVASYTIDPKPPRIDYSDLKPVADRQPVALVFDMQNEQGQFPEATAQLGSKLARVIEHSRLFAGIAKVPSATTAKLQITLRDMAGFSGDERKKLPPGLTSNLTNSEAAVLYLFSASFQASGQSPVSKVYHHAIHVLNSKSGWIDNQPPMTASQATGVMLEQLTLNFLYDLQREGKL
ncbi:MAG TPA: hypothetical protein VFT34_04730 [Verrucomicrobiae bacterium]|nr:hypothetical protein [Verrucomicrobiae bacterium]